jgi:L-fuculose-phosphate aldolase
MFRKDFVGIFHGSISAKLDNKRFLINKQGAIFDDLNDETLIELHFNHDYRWHEASIDAPIHKEIYNHMSEAKFIAYTMPPFTTAYSLHHQNITPKDYFGVTHLGEVMIIDPKQFDDWYDRARYEIYRAFLQTHQSILVIRGYGVYAYDRDIHALAKKIAVLENSCKLLMLSNSDEEMRKKAVPLFQGSLGL